MFEIRKVDRGTGITHFSTGSSIVDHWLRAHALHAQRYGTAVIYGLYDDGAMLGFYTLSACAIDRIGVENGWLRRNTPAQIPVILLGMLGVERSMHGNDLGAMLLKDAIERSVNAASLIGAKALVVDPVDPIVAGFYLHFGLKRIGRTSRLFIPLIA